MTLSVKVPASKHPNVDDFVWEMAETIADREGLQLGNYKGLVDERDSTGFYYHLFDARPDLQREFR